VSAGDKPSVGQVHRGVVRLVGLGEEAQVPVGLVVGVEAACVRDHREGGDVHGPEAVRAEARAPHGRHVAGEVPAVPGDQQGALVAAPQDAPRRGEGLAQVPVAQEGEAAGGFVEQVVPRRGPQGHLAQQGFVGIHHALVEGGIIEVGRPGHGQEAQGETPARQSPAGAQGRVQPARQGVEAQGQGEGEEVEQAHHVLGAHAELGLHGVDAHDGRQRPAGHGRHPGPQPRRGQPRAQPRQAERRGDPQPVEPALVEIFQVETERGGEEAPLEGHALAFALEGEVGVILGRNPGRVEQRGQGQGRPGAQQERPRAPAPARPRERRPEHESRFPGREHGGHVGGVERQRGEEAEAEPVLPAAALHGQQQEMQAAQAARVEGGIPADVARIVDVEHAQRAEQRGQEPRPAPEEALPDQEDERDGQKPAERRGGLDHPCRAADAQGRMHQEVVQGGAAVRGHVGALVHEPPQQVRDVRQGAADGHELVPPELHPPQLPEAQRSRHGQEKQQQQAVRAA